MANCIPFLSGRSVHFTSAKDTIKGTLAELSWAADRVPTWASTTVAALTTRTTKSFFIMGLLEMNEPGLLQIYRDPQVPRDSSLMTTQVPRLLTAPDKDSSSTCPLTQFRSDQTQISGSNQRWDMLPPKKRARKTLVPQSVNNFSSRPRCFSFTMPISPSALKVSWRNIRLRTLLSMAAF